MAGRMGFVRNNPWVQQDRMRKVDGLPPVANGQLPSPSLSSKLTDGTSVMTKTVIKLRDSGPLESKSSKTSPIINIFEKRAAPDSSSFLEKREIHRTKIGTKKFQKNSLSYESSRNLDGSERSDLNLSFDSAIKNRDAFDDEANSFDSTRANATPREIEYGPGIVKRLRDRFLLLAKKAALEAEAEKSQHLLHNNGGRPRARSVDNLISSGNGPLYSDEIPTVRCRSLGGNTEASDGGLNGEHSQSVSSLHTLIKYFNADAGRDDSDSQVFVIPEKKVEPIKIAETSAVPDPIARSSPESAKSVESPFFQQTSAPEEPTGAVESAGSSENRYSPLFQRPPGRPPSPPTMAPSQEEPEFVKMSRNLRKVPPGKTAATDLRSPPDPTIYHQKNFFKYSGAAERTVQMGPKEIFGLGADHSPPPEEPVPPHLATRHVEVEVEENDAGFRETRRDSASSTLSTDEETSYDFVQQQEENSEQTAAPLRPPRSRISTEAKHDQPTGLTEMHQLLNRFENLKAQRKAGSPEVKENSGEESEIKERKISTQEVGNNLDALWADIKEERKTEGSQDPLPKRISLSTQHRMKKQSEEISERTVAQQEKGEFGRAAAENFDSVDRPVEGGKTPGADVESTVEALRTMATTIAQYVSSPPSGSREAADLHDGRHTLKDHPDSVHDHGGIRYPKENEVLMNGSETLQMAGDGNFVRHTLLSLVSEEDLAQLLEDEEEFSFIFEGVEVVNENGILISKKRVRSKGSIDFSEGPATVYTYLQEADAETSGIWHGGQEISEGEYTSLCQEMREEYLLKRLELLEQEEAMMDTKVENKQLENEPGTSGGLVSYVPTRISSEEYELGVTNRWSYSGDSKENDQTEEMAETDRKECGANNDDSDDLSVRPTPVGDAFSKAETRSSDLLF